MEGPLHKFSLPPFALKMRLVIANYLMMVVILQANLRRILARREYYVRQDEYKDAKRVAGRVILRCWRYSPKQCEKTAFRESTLGRLLEEDHIAIDKTVDLV